MVKPVKARVKEPLDIGQYLWRLSVFQDQIRKSSCPNVTPLHGQYVLVFTFIVPDAFEKVSLGVDGEHVQVL